MTIASELTNLQTNLENAYTSCQNKSATMPQSQNFDNLSTCIASIPSGGGEISLTRFKDDTNTEIGTYFCNFTDGNGNKYKVILLDAQYRNSSGSWCSDTSTVTNMPMYSNLKSSNVWEAKETATQNTQLILDYCSSGGYTSTACSHCRSQSFTIGGVTYYGQLPNMQEVLHILMNYSSFDSMDTSASSYSSLALSTGIFARSIWSSNQYGSSYGWYSSTSGSTGLITKTSNNFVCPVLEIPNT